MKIALVTINNILNNSTWKRELQGLTAAGYHIGKYLSDEAISVEYINPSQKRFALLTRAKWILYHYLYKKDYYRWAEPLVAKNYAYQISQKLKKTDCNIVLCPENIVPIAYLDCQQPIILWTDATLTSLIKFYRHMDNLCDENIQNIYKMEAIALNRCKLIIYTSEWAAQTAINTYGISPEKVKVVPFGANLVCQRTEEDIREIIRAKDPAVCKLLFIGVDWFRKGGNTALNVAQELNNIGLKIELTIVGCVPPFKSEDLPEFVRVIGFINKAFPEGVEKINKLFAESHFLILPTLADCTPQVFAEANSFGVPVISTDVGGITTLVKDGSNGKLFRLNASVREYSSYIINLMTNYSEYESLAYSSFQEYSLRLNWYTAIQNIKHFLSE